MNKEIQLQAAIDYRTGEAIPSARCTEILCYLPNNIFINFAF